jgi:transposase
MDTDQAAHFGQALRALQPRQIGALPLLYPILDALQVRDTTNALVPSPADVDLGQMVVMLVLNRLLAPQPLYAVSHWLAGTVLPELLEVTAAQIYDNRLGRALARLYPHLGELWQRWASRAVQVYDLDLNVLHWDITSIDFEGAYSDSALASYGYSRDGRPDTKQVNLEVDVTHDGAVPVLYHVLPGNPADITRPLPHLQALLNFLARPELADRPWRPILVSDCKMITPEAVMACHQHQLGYLGPLADRNESNAVVASVSAAELAAQALAYRPQRVRADDLRFEPYQGVWRPFTFRLAAKQVTDRVLGVWRAGKPRLDERKRKSQLKRLLNGLAALQQKLNRGRSRRRASAELRLATLQQGNGAQALVDVQLSGEDDALTLTFRINRDRLAAAQQLDGRYALATNAGHLDANATLTLFKGQEGVEKRFRAAKGPLLVHPLFVRTDRRIEGLVCITLLALLVRAILEGACQQRGLRLTADRLLDDFANLQAVDLLWADGSRQRRAAELTPFQTQVLTTLGWPSAEAYAHLTGR